LVKTKSLILYSLCSFIGSYSVLFEEQNFQSQANPANLPAIAAVDAAAFLRRSNLSVQQLGQIWELADYQKKGVLDKNGFFIALKLVAAAQQGRPMWSHFEDPKRLPISPASISINTLKPPHFEGIPDKSAVSMSNPPCHDGLNPTGWCISAADQVKYDSIFDSLCPVDDKLPGVRVKLVLLNSGLNPAILAKIWELADQDKDGQLDRIEMAVAMHLVYRALQGDPVPAVLPHSLIHPSKVTLTRRTSTSSMNTGNAHPNIPMPLQNENVLGYRSRAGSMTSLDSIGRPHMMSHLENRSASVQPNYPATPVRGMGAPLSTSSNTSLEWPVDRLSSVGQFAACDTDSDGYVNGNDVKHVLLGSAQIWALCDINRTGKLNQEQFALINHLVVMRKRGEELPLTLPPFLIPPSLRVVPFIRFSEQFSLPCTFYACHLREADIQVSQLEADMKVKDSQIKNLQVELHTLELTVKQLERQKMEANRRLADLDDQIKQLELASVAQARKAEEAQTRLNQLVEDTQKDEACAEVCFAIIRRSYDRISFTNWAVNKDLSSRKKVSRFGGRKGNAVLESCTSNVATVSNTIQCFFNVLQEALLCS
uniref:Epidermal growth factor receptor substrate 15-like 1 n=1 Tax=Angiostrongylus costaricensis TaxID=334426 RepID=A0A0R3PN05_ANGCS